MHYHSTWFCIVSFISLQRNTSIEDFFLFFVTNLGSDPVLNSVEKDPSTWLVPFSLYQLKAAVKY